jgi:hypothetical protein
MNQKNPAIIVSRDCTLGSGSVMSGLSVSVVMEPFFVARMIS